MSCVLVSCVFAGDALLVETSGKSYTQDPIQKSGESRMTIDKSLRVRAGLVRSRSVLTRAERIAKLHEADRWAEGDPPVGLAKVRVQKLTLKKKKKVKKDEATETAEESAGTET